ncbi:Transcriptional regulator, HxlR family protein [Minicystis rosea]|nr:Transcriptional regulator, HxlR family protein [Minicystis rosea]
MKERRSYHQFCGLARALDLVGERWTLLIVRDLLIGPRRFVDLLEGLTGLTTNLLTKRLREMTEQGLVDKRKLPSPSASVVYELTPLGRALEPAVLALGAWGFAQLGKPGPDVRMDLKWALFSMKRRFRGVDETFTVELRAEARTFQYRLAPEGLGLQEGTPWEPDLILRGEDVAFRELFFLGATAHELERDGRLAIEGPRRLIQRFLRAFAPLPRAS